MRSEHYCDGSDPRQWHEWIDCVIKTIMQMGNKSEDAAWFIYSNSRLPSLVDDKNVFLFHESVEDTVREILDDVIEDLPEKFDFHNLSIDEYRVKYLHLAEEFAKKETGNEFFVDRKIREIFRKICKILNLKNLDDLLEGGQHFTVKSAMRIFHNSWLRVTLQNCPELAVSILNKNPEILAQSIVDEDR